jgi:hypothetical protein
MPSESILRFSPSFPPDLRGILLKTPGLTRD